MWCAASAATDNRAGVWDGRVATGPEETGPAPDGDYAFTVTVRDRRGQPHRGAGAGAQPAGGPTRAPASRCATSACAVHSTPWPRARWPGSRSAPSTAPSTSCSHGWATPSRSAAAGASAARSAWAFRGRPRPGSTWCACGPAISARCGRLRWPACPRRSRRWAVARALAVLPALTWQGLNPVDDDADGFADTLASSRSVRLDRPFADGRLAAGLQLRGRPTAALARPRATRL